MCRKSCIDFVINNLTKDDVEGKRLIEIGSRNINGSIRKYIMKVGKPDIYIGIDIIEGECVDVVCSAENIVEKFGDESFDIVLSTETFEHLKDWKKSTSEIKKVCKKGGLILITTVCKGFKLHEFPSDFWRFELEDLSEIFSDCKVLVLDKNSDPKQYAVHIKVRKTDDFVEKDLSRYKLYNIQSDNRI